MSPAARQWARDRADDAFQLVGLAVTLGVIIFRLCRDQRWPPMSAATLALYVFAAIGAGTVISAGIVVVAGMVNLIRDRVMEARL